MLRDHFQQRARFPRELLEKLPKLKLMVTNGRTSSVVDHEARRERGILMCGAVDDPPASQGERR